jgi:hypothetical protein
MLFRDTNIKYGVWKTEIIEILNRTKAGRGRGGLKIYILKHELTDGKTKKEKFKKDRRWE